MVRVVVREAQLSGATVRRIDVQSDMEGAGCEGVRRSCSEAAERPRVSAVECAARYYKIN